MQPSIILRALFGVTLSNLCRGMQFTPHVWQVVSVVIGHHSPYFVIIVSFELRFPGQFWEMAIYSSGYDIASVVSVSRGAESINPDTRDETHKYLVAQLNRHINYRRSKKVS